MSWSSTFEPSSTVSVESALPTFIPSISSSPPSVLTILSEEDTLSSDTKTNFAPIAATTEISRPVTYLKQPRTLPTETQGSFVAFGFLGGVMVIGTALVACWVLKRRRKVESHRVEEIETMATSPLDSSFRMSTSNVTEIDEIQIVREILTQEYIGAKEQANPLEGDLAKSPLSGASTRDILGDSDRSKSRSPSVASSGPDNHARLSGQSETWEQRCERFGVYIPWEKRWENPRPAPPPPMTSKRGGDQSDVRKG